MYHSSDGYKMPKLIDLAGKKINYLTVLGRSAERRSSGALWICKCECGIETVVDTVKLRSGSTKSCGCKRNDGHNNYRHGHSARKTTTYRSWKEMRQRCTNPNNDKWKWYGGRGITICARWSEFANFLEDMGERPEGKTIDRINSDGNYELANCRWATPKQQAETNRGTFQTISI